MGLLLQAHSLECPLMDNLTSLCRYDDRRGDLITHIQMHLAILDEVLDEVVHILREHPSSTLG